MGNQTKSPLGGLGAFCLSPPALSMDGGALSAGGGLCYTGRMNKPLSAFSLLLAATLGLWSAGCVSTVSVTTDEPGALVRYRGKGRPSYRWTTAGLVRKAGTPCTFQAPYSTVTVYAVWDEGTPGERRTEPVDIRLSNWSDPPLVRLPAPKR